MYENVIRGFVRDVISTGKEEITVSKGYLLSLYAMAKETRFDRESSVIDSGVWRGAPFVEVYESFDVDGIIISFDVVFGADGIGDISVVISWDDEEIFVLEG